MHNDHAGSLSQFILYLWFVYNKKIKVISKCEKIKEYLDITGTAPEGYELINSYPNIEFIKTEHVKHLDSYGFKIEIEGKTIIYTGDTKTLNSFMLYMNNCDELYVDVSKIGDCHIKFEDVISQLKEIKKNGTKIFLMHLDDKEYISKLNNNEFIIL